MNILFDPHIMLLA